MDKKSNTINGILSSFVNGYRNRPPEVSPTDWLDGKFAEYPEIWESEEERRNQAIEVVEGVEGYRESAKRLDQHLAAGKSPASFIGESISRGCQAGGVAATGHYVAGIDAAIDEANRVMAETVFVHNPDGTIDYTRVSQAPNLNGNIAEAHHAGTFNIDAATKESSLHATMPASHGRNSVDLMVEDSSGHIVRRYQSKYGKDAETTQNLFGNKYRGQRKLVPEGQAEQIEGATDHMEADGVASKPLSKEDAVEMQKETQTSGKAHEYDWEDANMGTVAKSIGKKAAIAGMFAIGFQGARILGRRAWNALSGKRNPPIGEDLTEFMGSAVKSGAGAAGAVAVAGGLVVAARKGLLGAALKSVKGNMVGNAVCMAVENIKILYKVGKGEIAGKEALDCAGRANVSLLGSLALGAKGAAAGAAIGTALGPVGTAVGGVIGGIAGGIAGSVAGEALYSGAKKVVKAVCSVASRIATGIGRCVESVGRMLNPLNWFS